MKCNDVHKELVAYIDDELPPMGMRAIEEHLARCPECTAEGKKLRETLARTRQVESIQPAQDWWEKLQERVHTFESEPNLLRKTHILHESVTYQKQD